jgi:hypothetical protein
MISEGKRKSSPQRLKAAFVAKAEPARVELVPFPVEAIRILVCLRGQLSINVHVSGGN